MRVATVTPFFRDHLNADEQISARALLRVLNEVEHIAVGPAGPIKSVKAFHTVEFPAAWFSSPQAFEQLLLSPSFYQRFANYDYLLVYQLSSLILSDRLENFCRAGFDYIAPPALRGYACAQPPAPIFAGSGHGGFSLRRVAACLEVFESYARQAGAADRRGELQHGRAADLAHEGYFWARRAPSINSHFRVAPTAIALEFAWGKHPEFCFAEMHGRLPFGCDGWATHGRSFWQGRMVERAFEPERPGPPIQAPIRLAGANGR